MLQLLEAPGNLVNQVGKCFGIDSLAGFAFVFNLAYKVKGYKADLFVDDLAELIQGIAAGPLQICLCHLARLPVLVGKALHFYGIPVYRTA